MDIRINTESKQAFINGEEYLLTKKSQLKNLADVIEQWIGAKEWDETVTTIITWYYGDMRKVAWCAITVSYVANLLDKLDQIGGKAADCDVIKNRMISLDRLDATAQYGGGAYQAKRGDIIFLSSKHTLEDVTHVGIVSEIDHATGRVVVTSGNSADQIKKDEYNYRTNPKVVAFGNIND